MFDAWRIRDGDRLHGGGAFQFERLFVRVTPWRVILAGTGVGAYLVGLVLYLPAEAVTGSDRQTVGTVWNGETAMEPGFALDWSVAPLRSLIALAPAGSVAVRGPDTAIIGDAVWRSNAPVLRRAEGTGSLRLLSAVAPGLPFDCDGEMTLEATDLAIGGGATGEGRVRTGSATCAGAGTMTAPPPMTGDLVSDADGSSLSLKGVDGGELVRARLTQDKALSLTVTPAGATALPGMTATTLEVR